MNKERDEKLLKSWLKKKITITTATVVAFLIAGSIISTPIYASVLIGATENDNLTVTKTNNQGSKVDNSGITIGGAISKAGSDSVHIGDYSGSMGTRNVVIGTNASAGYDAKKPDDNPPKDDNFNQSVAIGAGRAAGEGARAYGDQSIAIGSNTIARGNSSIAIGNDDVDKTGSTNTTYTDLNGKTKTGSIANAYAELTGESLGVGQYQDTTSKEAAVAIGVKSVAGDISLALGTGARAEKVNAVAIGTGATANRDNAIAIGGGSTTDKAATQELSTTVNGLTFKWSGGDRTLAGDVVSFGKAGYERQLKHVSPGKVSEDSTDAINGSQLHGVLSHLTEDPVFMFAADDSDKSNVVGDTPAKKQEDGKIKKIVARSISDSRLNILGGAEGNNLSDKNISVRYEDEKTLKIKLAKNLTELESAEFKNTGGDKTTINGDGVTITPVANGKKPVSVTKDGLNNGGNVIANVAGNLEGAKPNSTEPTTNATVPTDVDSIKNNAATVGDVLNAGWNLQNNGKAKDFVKPYDTVNFADGNGTTAVVDTEADRSTSKIKYNVNLGNGLQKDAATNKITVKTADESLTVDADGLKAKTDGKTITTGDSGLKVVTGKIESGTTPGTMKVKDGDAGKIATVDSVVKAVNSAAFTLKASSTTGGTRNGSSTVEANGEAIKAGSTIEMIAGKNLDVKHDENGKITFATVENPSFKTVQVGGDQGPKFSKTSDGNIKVSDKDGENPVKITNVKDGAVNENSKDAINGSQFHKLANNTIKLAGKNGSDAATETDAQNLNQQDGIKFTVKSSDGKLLEVTAGGDTITLTPKTGTITTTNGVPTANTTNGKLVTADQIVNALTEMGWKATADKDGTGTVTGTTSELIKAGETVTFKAGDNLAIKQDGKNFIYSLNTALSGLTSAEFKDDNKNKVNITPTGITITKPADTVNNQPGKTVTLNQDGLNNGGNLITNVASNLDGAKTGTIAPTTKATAPTNIEGIKNNAATVGDVLNAGWNLQGNNKDVDFVKPYDTVNFINGDGTTATVETTDNKVSTVKYSVNLGDGLKKDDTGNTISIKPADKSLEVNKDGLKVKTDNTTITTGDSGLKVVTGAIESVTTGADSGTVKVKEDDTGKIATVDSVVNAVNSAAFTLKASATTGGTRNGSSSVGANGEAIKAGKTIEMIAGKNLNVTHNENGKIIFATVDTPTFSTVQVGGDQGPKFSKTSDGDIKVSDKDGANPVKITNVKDGAVTDTSTDAINGSQFHKVANNTIKLAGQNGDDVTTATQTKEQNLNKQGGIKFTVKSSDGKLLEVKAADDTITLTPKTATITTGTDGVPTANTNGGKLVTADDLVTVLKNMGWKAIAGQEGSGTVAGNAEQLIKAGDTVTFKAGDNLVIKQAGKDFTYSLAKELKDLSKVEVKDTSGNSVVTTPTGTTTTDGTNTTTVGPTGTTTKDKDGNETKVTKDGVTITPGKDDPANPGTKIPDTDKAVSLTKDGLNNGGNKITNVTSGLDKITTGPAKDLVDLSKPTGGSTPKVSDNTAATVGDLRNMGWVVSSDKTTDNLGTAYSEAVKNANEVKFVGKGAATVSGKTVDGVRTVTVDVTVPNVEKGTIEPDTGDNKGKVKSKAGDGDKFTTVDTVVNAINSAAWKATSGVEGTGTTATSGHTKSDEEIKAGDTVTFKAGDNLKIKQSGKEFTYSLNPELTNLSKVEVKDDKGNSVVTTPTGTTITGKDTTDPTKDITTVINAGGTTVTDKDGNTTKVDGNGITITPKNDPANPVKLTKDGLNNGGNAITNVAGNLEGAKKDTNSPKTSSTGPSTTDLPNIVNNAATVGDVLNAGWNLQNNGDARDFVKPYDTVNFVDGLNTKAIVTTDADGKVSNVQIDVKDLPIAYTNEAGDKVVKAADGKYYKESDLAGKVYDPATKTFKNANGTAATQPTEVAKDAIKTNLVNPKAEGNKAGDPTELGNVESGLDTIKDATGGTTPSTTAKTAGLVNLDEKDPATNKLKVSDNNVATVGDLRNMGWVVSSDKTTDGTGEYSAQVKNANEVRFVGKGTATVSGKTDANGVRTITVEVNDQVSTNNSVTPVVYTKADGTKVYPVKKDDGTIEYHTTPDGKGAGDTVVPKNEVITSVNGPEGTKIPTTLSNVAGNLDGAKTGTTAPTTNAALPNTTDKTGNNYINPNNAATVGDVLNAGWNLQNNGTAKDFVKPYDTVNFINGGNTTAVVTTDKDGTTSNVTYNVTGLPITYTNEAGKPVSKVGDNYYVVNEKGQPLQNDGTPVTKYDANGNPLNDDGTPVTKVDTATKPLSTNLVNPNATTDKQTTEPTTLKNVKGNLPQVNDKDKTVFDPKTGTTKPADDKNTTKAPITAADAADIVKNAGNNAATVGDVLNAGWNLQGNGDAKDFVKPYDTVNFIDGGNTKAVVTTAEDGKSSTVTYNVTGLPITYTDKDGNPVAKVGDKFYPVDANGNPVITKDASGNPTNAVDPSTLKTNMVNPTAKPNEIGKPTKLSNVAPAEISKTSTDAVNGSQLNNTKDNNPFEYADKDGNPVVKANDGKFYDPKAINSDGKPKETQVVGNDTYLKEDLDENGTPKAGATPLKVKDPLTTDKVDVHSKETKPITNVVSGLDNFKDKTGVEKPLNDLRDLNKVGADGKPVVKDNTAATVGDLRNMGWIVSSDKKTGDLTNAYSEAVKNANEVKFVGKNGIQVSGKTDDKGVRTLTFEMEAGEVTPTEITKADGTKLVKVGDKVYKPEDIGTDGQPKQGKDPVGTIANDGKVYNNGDVTNGAPNNGANPIDGITVTPNNGSKFVTGNQVADAIEKSGFVVGKNNKALSASDFENKDEKVNPNDELRFADGDNTNVKLATKEVLDASGKVKTVTTVKVDVVDLPVKYTDADGNIVKKGEDGKYYNPKDLEGKVYDPTTKEFKNSDGTALDKQPEAKNNIVSSLVNPNDAKDGKVGTPSTLTNIANGAKTFEPVAADGTKLVQVGDKFYPADKVENGVLKPGTDATADAKDPVKVANDGKWYLASQVEANGKPKENATPIADVPNNIGKSGLVDFSNSNPNNAATVGDLQNLGFVVSTSDNNYSDQVRNANKVDFKGGNGIEVTGKTTADGTREVTVSVKSGDVVSTNKEGKRGTITTPEGKVDVVKGDDNKWYKESDLGVDGKPKTGANAVDVTTNPVTTNKGAGFVTGNQVGDAIEKSGWNVGLADPSKASEAFNDDSKALSADKLEKVNPDDNVRFADGKNTKVQAATMDEVNKDGKKITNTYVRFNVDLPISQITSEDKDGNKVAKAADGKWYPVKEGKPDTTKEALEPSNVRTSASMDPDGLGDKYISTTSRSREESLTPTQLGELTGKQEAAAKAAEEKIKDLLKGQSKDVIEAASKAAVNAAKEEAKVQYLKDNGLDKGTGGTVISNVAWGTKPSDAVNVDQLQNSGINVHSRTVEGSTGKVISGNTSPTKVKMDETVNVDAGNNIEITRNGRDIAIATSMNPQFDSVQFGKEGPKITGKAAQPAKPATATSPATPAQPAELSVNGAKIADVAPGRISATSTDAINGSQLHAVASNLNNKINKVGKRADAGTASALAAATIPQAYTPGKSLVGIAAGNYQGQNSLAVGMSRISDNGKIIIRLSGTANTQGKTGVAAGVGYQW